MAAPKKSVKKKVALTPAPFNDLNTQADEQVSPGDYVDVVAGPHKGRYGAILDTAGVRNLIVRTRDEHGERIVVAYEDCRPAQAGRR